MKRKALTRRYFIIYTFLIGVTIFSANHPNLAHAESEPNGSIGTADPIGIGLQNAESNATLTSDDYDYYAFTAEAGRTYVFETYNVQGTGTRATGLWLYDSGGTEITSDIYGTNGSGNANARIIYSFITTGTYYLLVKDATYATWTGTYSLRILPQHDEPGATWDAMNDAEPNDVRQLANEIKVGLGNAQTHEIFNNSNLVSEKSDYDYYRFAAEAGRTYIIETFDIQGTGTRATGLWLLDSSGSEITTDIYGSNGSGDTNARIAYTFSTSGTYYILVKDATYATWTGTYSLRILPQYDEPGAAWDAGNDSEPNDVRQLANDIQIGLGNTQTRTLFNNNDFVTERSDYDYYRFTAEAGKTYIIETFDIQGTSTRATGLWLYDGSGAEITNDGYGNKGSGNVNARIVYTFSTSGTYYILVKDATYATWTGTYSLRVLPKHGETGATWDAGKDNEPNDEPELANELKLGINNAQTHVLFDHTNFVTSDSDHDYYHFSAEAGQTYVIETFNVQDAAGRATGLWLYDSSGTEITNDRYGRNGSGLANTRITYKFATTGTYYLLVKDATSTIWAGTYSIRIIPETDGSAPSSTIENDYEPNDVINLASNLSLGSGNSEVHRIIDTTSFVSSNPDFDFYRIIVSANTPYVFQTYNLSADSYATGLKLYDAAGTELASDNRGDSKTGEAEIEHTFTTPGEYYLLARSSSSNEDWSGSYEIRYCQEICANQIFLPLVVR